MTRDLPTISEAKQEAKHLRATLAEQDEAISHAQALERVAQRHGFRDWNAFHAAMRDRPPQGWTVGGRVTGRYLSQPFAATVLAADQFRPGLVPAGARPRRGRRRGPLRQLLEPAQADPH
jgi:hypothetical protein